AGARFLCSGGVLYAFLRWRGAPKPTARQWTASAIAGTFLLLGGNGLVAWAEQFVPSGVTALLVGITPLFFVLTEWAWPGGTRPSLVTMAALLLGFAGVAWLAAPWENGAHEGVHVGGALAIIGAALSWAIGSIYSRHAKHSADPMLASALQMLTGGTVLTFVALLHGDFSAIDFPAISLRSWTAFAYLTLFGSLVGFSTFVWLMKHSTPARVSTYAYVNPVVAVLLGWWIADEVVTARTLTASVVIVSAVVIITLQRTRVPAQR
ncbi:MAG TPA: EamA family transporter, partial [Opitutus sp.]|nr:EamA family transporter [Opitutus sp.]